MSLAPASSRGFFLNARLAVNGIQCAARSFGTLMAAGLGLFSSMDAFFCFGAWGGGLLSRMDASLSFGAWRVRPKLSASLHDGNAGERTISAQSGVFGGK